MSDAPFRRAAILAVGSELLTPTRFDTNSLHITGVLTDAGVEIVFKGVVGDDRLELAAQFSNALLRADLVVFTGGLGPTDDDLTREVVAAVLGLSLDEDPTITATIRRRFEARGWTMPEVNRRQAMVPAGAVVLANGNGTAPGLWIEVGDKAVALLPGPPREMKPLLATVLDRWVRPRSGGVRTFRRLLRIAGRTESRVEELTQPIYSRWRSAPVAIETTILAAPAQIELHLTARGHDAATIDAALDHAVRQIEAVLSVDLFSSDGSTIEEVVGRLLRQHGARIALAESCTGGLATSRLTDVAGSSDYVDRSVVAYSNAAKVEWVGVPADLIESHGAVSEPVASALAEGIRARAGVAIGVGITGIAGPDGGSDAKPVGTVAIAVAGPEHTVRTFRFPGNRELVKTFAASTALDMVRRMLLSAAPNTDWTLR